MPRKSRARSRSGSRGRSRARSKSRNRGGLEKEAFAKNTSEPSGGRTTVIVMRQSVTLNKIGEQLVPNPLAIKPAEVPSSGRGFAEYRIRRVGISIFNQSAEFIVRTGSVLPTTYKALRLALDLQQLRQIQGGPLVVWFRPDQGVQKNWQPLDITGTYLMNSGLILVGVADELSADILVLYEIDLRGGNGPSISSFTKEELLQQLSKLTIASGRIEEEWEDVS